MSPPHFSLQIGEILNDTYRVESLLAQGGTASVYVVSTVSLGVRYALKVITSELRADPEFLLRFRREAEILARLDHPHVVKVHAADTTAAGRPFMVLELLHGEDLAYFLEKSGALSPAVALPIFLQVAEALQAAHERGIVHRDLKPANVFLCDNGPFPNFVKVLDFGVAQVATAGSLCDEQYLLGTPAYMSPEQARGGPAALDGRSDQFTSAAVLYEMLTGKPAFYRRGQTTEETLERIATAKPLPLPLPRIEAAVRRALSKDPADRFATMRDFVEATGAADLTASISLVARTLRLTPPGSSLTPPALGSHPSRRHGELYPNPDRPPPPSLAMIALGVLLVLTGTCGGLWMLNRSHSSTPAARNLAPLLSPPAPMPSGARRLEPGSGPRQPRLAEESSPTKPPSSAESFSASAPPTGAAATTPSATPAGGPAPVVPRGQANRPRSSMRYGVLVESEQNLGIDQLTSCADQVLVRLVQQPGGERYLNVPINLGRSKELSVMKAKIPPQSAMDLEHCLHERWALSAAPVPLKATLRVIGIKVRSKP